MNAQAMSSITITIKYKNVTNKGQCFYFYVRKGLAFVSPASPSTSLSSFHIYASAASGMLTVSFVC